MYLNKLHKTYLIRSHPNDDNWFGVKGREYLLLEGKKAHISASLFYLIDVIRSVLLYDWRRIDCIIFVRYLMGTAYLPSPLHKLAYLFFSKIVPSSTLMFYINVSPNEAMRRINLNRLRKERFETSSELTNVSVKALELIRYGNWIIIDGDKSINQVHKEIVMRIKNSTNLFSPSF